MGKSHLHRNDKVENPPRAGAFATPHSTFLTAGVTLSRMATRAESPLDELWNEYSQVFRDFDDLTLARWMAQTLGQLQGKSWRLSHPLVAAYRLATHQAH